ncbi:anaerobic ribonucleoside triphosphate reductase [Breznakiella homolactica]|uniref:Anaerobic ribonucleoside triphosphate reductase n=1 Tax=Breznakiella homolactica TaxID=2798577 RepID=A0A7T8BA71_9SPIR|nr:anaerobic ribonucleoside triphosphate reductase [Breznakiella homolactica]QQO08690.1 anaerobic ribonucleoside triphosphate reductase [Breznakiella homolactica]
MPTRILKRDGREAPFNIEKITNAIYKAGIAAGTMDWEQAMNLSESAAKRLQSAYAGTTPGVEEIQDTVEQIMIENGLSSAAKKFILYRAERTRIREMNTRLMRIFEEITTKDAKDNDLKRENANIDGDTSMGHMLKYGSEGAKQFNELFILKPGHARAHHNGDIHIHDLDFLTLTTTCCQIDIAKLFTGGFGTGHGVIREPNDIQSYSALACIAIQSNQNDQHGGQSIPNFDRGLAPGVAKTYVRLYRDNLFKALDLLAPETTEQIKETLKAELFTGHLKPSLEDNEAYTQAESGILDKWLEPKIRRPVQDFARNTALRETDRRTYQAMEALIHNLNTMHSRAGAQIPFSSINYGTDTSPEARMLIRNLLAATESGLGDGETAIFPIQIFRVKEGVNYNPGDPNYDLFQQACRVSSKRLFPNFSFQDAPFNFQYYREGRPETEIAYMGCRTRVIANVHDQERQTTYGRGNLSFTTINLPRIALKARGDTDEFFRDLDGKIDLVIDQLLERFEIQARKKVKNFPFLMGQGIWLDSDTLGWEDELREILKHGTLTAGFIGLAECLKALCGKHHGESAEAQALGLRIIGHMRSRMDAAVLEHRLNFSLIATPAEGTAGRFVKMDREKFGSIPGVTDREYYTNSFHIPVHYPIGALKKIELEAPYHAMTNAGHISYIELDGDASKNPEAFEKIVRAMKEAGIGYGSLNHPVDRDPVCGYRGIIGETCPRCGRSEGDEPFERIRRITGYLVGTLDRFNNAKRAEERDRVKHFNVSGGGASSGE